MMGIFSDMIELILEIFMDDFSIFGDSYEGCRENLRKVLERCQEKNLVLNWEKCHFMVTQGIVIGHIVSKKGIEVDKSKVELISNLPTPKCVKDIRSFLGHAGFYRRFIRDFSAIAPPLCNMLAKDVPFAWSQACDDAFDKLKTMLVSPPIMRSPNWELPFEIMCDASDYAIGAFLGQREDKKAFVIYYASKTLDSAPSNYITTEKEFLAVVFALEKFKSYIIGSLGGVIKRNMMPLTPILIIEIFDCWGLDFMKPFPPSFGYLYILLAFDYVSKWVEAVPTRTNDHKVALKFLKEHIFFSLWSASRNH